MTTDVYGFLSYNMFTYCYNTPENMFDDGGNSPFGALQIYDYYLIHKIVQYQCATMYGWNTEIYVKKGIGKDSKRGFLDLYDQSSLTYYEVKSIGVFERGNYTKQLDKYNGATVQDTPGNKKKGISVYNVVVKPGQMTGKGFHFKYGIYDVSWEFVGNGLIVYDPNPNKCRAAACAVVITAAAVCIAAPEAAAAVAPTAIAYMQVIATTV